MIRVELDEYEMTIAGYVGAHRHADSVAKDRADSSGKKRGENQWSIDCNAACAELAVAKAFQKYWNGMSDIFKECDVSDVQVRHSGPPTSDLILRYEDSPDEMFILVTGIPPVYTIRGWIWGRDGKLDKYLDNPYDRGPAYFVPQCMLHQISLPKRSSTPLSKIVIKLSSEQEEEID